MFDFFNWAAESAVDSAGGKKSVFGEKPQVASYVPTDLSAEIGKATSANLGNYDSITALLNKVIPGFSDMLGLGTANATSLLRGEIPKDVQDQVQRSSAFKSLIGGFSGSDMSRALTARDLGRTSLDLTQIGQNSAQMWSKLAESAYSPFTVSTMQQAGTTAANNAGEQASQQFQFNVDAAPDPGAAGIFNLQTALGMKAASFGMAAAGGGMGGTGDYNPTATNRNWQLLGGNNGAPAYQYNPSTGAYGQVPVATTWGG